MFSRLFISFVDVPAVASQIPTEEQLFAADGKPNTKFLREHFALEGKLGTSQTLRIIKQGTELLRSESTLLVTDAPITSKLPTLFSHVY